MPSLNWGLTQDCLDVLDIVHFDMRRHKLHHFIHCAAINPKHRLELLIWNDHSLVIGVLKIVLFDVRPHAL